MTHTTKTITARTAANENAKDFMAGEALQQIAYTLEYFGGCYCDLHNDCFNLDYYFIYTDDVEKALENYGVFDAIHTVQDYEKFNFGEIYTDIGDPVKVANMLWYIIGDEIIIELFNLDEFSELWNEDATPENNKKLIDFINNLLVTEYGYTEG